MPATYEPIATTTLSVNTNTITFSSIPATFTDLKVIVVGTCNNAGQNVQFRINSDVGTNYSNTRIRGNGTGASSFNAINQSYGFTGQEISDTIPCFYELDFFSYSGSTNKTILSSENCDKNGSGVVQKYVNLWRSTSAITSITLIVGNGSSDWKTGTTATLYGIKAA